MLFVGVLETCLCFMQPISYCSFSRISYSTFMTFNQCIDPREYKNIGFPCYTLHSHLQYYIGETLHLVLEWRLAEQIIFAAG